MTESQQEYCDLLDIGDKILEEFTAEDFKTVDTLSLRIFAGQYTADEVRGILFAYGYSQFRKGQSELKLKKK